MKLFGMEFGVKSEPMKNESVGDVSVNYTGGVNKAYIPEFLYKPPFGYPRKENLPLMRQLARNPYIYGVIRMLADEVASTDYDVVYQEGVEPSDAMDSVRDEILRFLDNPNNNKESFQTILRAVVKDVYEVDAGVIIKVFNKQKKMVEMFARDGASFLKNPDIYGYMGNRSEYVEPANINYGMTPSSPDWQASINQYELSYKDVAAYFQYGTTAMALPVPFGRREVMYLMLNPRSDSVYGLSPIQILADTITTLIYGANYNLDFYMNGNMPEGIISLIGANQESIDGFRKRFDGQFREKDPITGFMRKIGFKYPIINQEPKFVPFQLDPKVMQIIEQQTWFTKLVWSCFGVTPDEMGFTEDSNKAVSQSQSAVYKRKGVRPLLKALEYQINKEIIAEWGPEVFDSLMFKWDDYDLEEDIKKHSLYESQIRMGIKTAEMIAEEEHINVEELKRGKEEERQQRMEEEASKGFGGFGQEAKSLKALGIQKDTRVKVISNHKAHAGKTGLVESVRNNGEEQYYIVRFQDGMDIFFYEELKVVDGGVPLEMPEPVEEEEVVEKSLKGEEPWNNLEKELVDVIKSRGRELVARMDLLKNGELDRIR